MAELDVQRKDDKGNNKKGDNKNNNKWWIWAVVAIIVILVLWIALDDRTNVDPDENPAVNTTTFLYGETFGDTREAIAFTRIHRRK